MPPLFEGHLLLLVFGAVVAVVVDHHHTVDGEERSIVAVQGEIVYPGDTGIYISSENHGAVVSDGFRKPDFGSIQLTDERLGVDAAAGAHIVVAVPGEPQPLTGRLHLLGGHRRHLSEVDEFVVGAGAVVAESSHTEFGIVGDFYRLLDQPRLCRGDCAIGSVAESGLLAGAGGVEHCLVDKGIVLLHPFDVGEGIVDAHSLQTAVFPVGGLEEIIVAEALAKGCPPRFGHSKEAGKDLVADAAQRGHDFGPELPLQTQHEARLRGGKPVVTQVKLQDAAQSEVAVGAVEI